MDIQPLVDQELHKIHRSRTRVAYIPNILAFSASLYFQREKLQVDSLWILTCICVYVGTFFRVIVGEFLFESWAKHVRSVVLLNYLAVFLLGAGLGLHFRDIVIHYGAQSINVYFTLLLVIGYMSGAAVTLVANRFLYLIFIFTLSSICIGTFLIDYSDYNLSFVFFITLFMIFSLYQGNLAHKQLYDLVVSRTQAGRENERLKFIIDTVPGLVGLIHKDRRFYLANQATLAIYPDMIGKEVGTLDVDGSWESSVLDFMESGRAHETTEKKTLLNGEEVWLLMNLQRNQDGGVIMVSIITTDLVEAQKRVREQEAKAQYSAKLASLGQMAAGIAHEVNNPLTIILGTATVLQRMVDADILDKTNLKNLTAKMVETVNRISKIIKSLKTLSRNGATDPMETISLKHLLSQCSDISSMKLRQLDVCLNIDEFEDLKIFGREVQLCQVFLNLLGNASDAIKNLPDRWIQIKVKNNEDWIEIFVIDSGHGIPENVYLKMMEPFYTTKDVGEGTGLGLSISKSIIQEHQGELAYLPNEERTTFKIKLPVIAEI